MITIILLGLAVSFDGFVAGFAYGVRRLEIPLVSLLIVSLLSALSMALSIGVGKLISLMFHINVASLIGGAILFVIGIWIIVEALFKRKNRLEAIEEKVAGDVKFRYIRKVLREPIRADIDCSGSISSSEAILLGAALAMDAFGAGIGASMAGLPLLWTSVTVGLIKLVLIKSGVLLGKRIVTTFSIEKASCVAGGILIFLGFITFCS